MEQTLRAFFCPCCGARLSPPTHRVVSCEYCDARLQAEPQSIVEEMGPDQPREFASELRQARHGRFEMSWLYQAVVDKELDLLHFAELSDSVAALVYFRRCDAQGVSQPGPLPLEPVVESLEAYRDPGLAAHRALEWLCEQGQGFSHLLECCICVLDSARSVAQIYTAGTPRSLYWVSNELASVTDVGGYQAALERKMLLEARDNFSLQPDRQLAAYDSLVFVSAAYAGRGDGPYADGSGALCQELQNQLGEDPLRLVTLAKNAFWQKRSPAARESTPGNSLHVVALQARPSDAAADFRVPALEVLSSRAFETAAWTGPEDFFEILPLHGDRNVVVWASNDGLPWSPQAAAQLRAAILEVLDRKDHGDNDNPREAGRRAQQNVAVTRLAVIQLLDCYGRVKYFRAGLPHPVYLAPRGPGQNASSIMAFDEGGEVTLDKGARLLFLGREVAQMALSLPALAENWPGGKASNLYATLCKLWTTPPAAAALQKTLKAIAGDGNLGRDAGYLLVGAR